jgi:hypothetical protein
MAYVLFIVVLCLGFWPVAGRSAVIGYNFTVTTAYAVSDPFPDRLDPSFTEPDTGYFEISDTGKTSFLGVVGTIAVSPQVGDLSFTSGPLVLAPGQSVSVAIPDNSANVGGFNGPAYFYRPGIEITLNGLVSNGLATEAVSLLVADRDIHSGVPRTDQYGLTSDSFVLQGGDPWGFDTGAAFGLSQADGVFVFAQVTEPGTLMLFVVAIAGLAVASRLRPRKPTRPRRRV